MILAAGKTGDSPIKSDMKKTFEMLQVFGDHTIGPKIMENGDNYSTALWRNMRRSPRGNLVQ